MLTRKPFRTMKTVSANEAKQRFGAITAEVARTGEAVIVEFHGTPRVAIVPVDQETVDTPDRTALASKWSAYVERAESRQVDLSPEEIERIAIEAGREVNRAVAEMPSTYDESEP